MYTSVNFKTKKALKAAVSSGEKVTVFQPGINGAGYTITTGRVYLEGPHYPAPHTWYAQADIKEGIIQKVW